MTERPFFFFANFSNCSPSLRWVRDFLVSHDLSLPSHGCGCCRSQLCLVFASCSPLVQLFDFPWSQLVKDRHTELPLAATPDWWSRVFSFPHPFRFEMRIYNLAMIKKTVVRNYVRIMYQGGDHLKKVFSGQPYILYVTTSDGNCAWFFIHGHGSLPGRHRRKRCKASHLAVHWLGRYRHVCWNHRKIRT